MNANIGDRAYSFYKSDPTPFTDNPKQAFSRSDYMRCRHYYDDMKRAITEDYRNAGNCTLFDKILNGEFTCVDYITYAAMYGACGEFCGYKTGNDPEKIPYTDARWLDKYRLRCDLTQNQRLKKIRDCDSRIRKVLEKAGEGRPSPKLIPITDENAGIGSPPIECRSTYSEITAGTEAERILADARAEAEQILTGARAEAEQILKNAAQEAEQILSGAEQKAKEDSGELILKYLEPWQDQVRRNLETDYTNANRGHEEMDRSFRQTQDDMRMDMDQARVEITKALVNAVDQLNDLRYEIDQSIEKGERALYMEKYKPLAMNYREFSRITSLNRMIREELLRIVQEGKPADPERTAEDLLKLANTLEIWKAKFERSLNALGMYAYIPEAGELFDDACHDLEDTDETDPYGKTVVRCIYPGMRRKGDAGCGMNEDEVMLPAVVEVR